MADETQVKILREGGAKIWNKWRKANSRIYIDLRNADFSGQRLTGVDFSGLLMPEADLREADLSDAKLSWACLDGSTFRRANFEKADLKNGRLINVDFTHANLSDANLSGTDVTASDFRGTNLNGTDFSMCSMNSAQFVDVDLSRTKGLETVRHSGPSTIGLDTIYLSGGKIPEIFLRGAGAPEPFISNMKSLVAAMSPIEFYSCFISYSSKDREFAERLHADLQSKGVRCWYAPEDLKIGDRLRPAFDEAIRLHDKLMVVLSGNSVGSPWVEKEVETAFENERKQNRTVLFPIRIDDAVMDTDQAWASDIRRARHIGDFKDWKNHDSYKKAFERLLRDLKS